MGSRVWLRRRRVLRSGFGDLIAGGGGVSFRSNSSTSEVVGGIGVRSNVSGDFLLGAVDEGRFPAARTGGLVGGWTGALLAVTAERAAAMVAVRLDVEAVVLCSGLLGSLR